MLVVALALVVSAHNVGTLRVRAEAPRHVTATTLYTTLKPIWLISLGDDPRETRTFPRPEYGSAFNMYAEAGGLQVGPGLRTDAWVYDCSPDKRPQCRVGRPDITLPKNLGPLIGLTLHMGKLIMTEVRLARRLPPPRAFLLRVLNALPIINLSFLDRGAYTNVLFVY